MPQQTANVNLIKGDSIDPKTDYRDALPVNMYAVKKPVLGAAGYMLCYPGLTKVTDGQGKDRAANYNDRFDTQFRLSGDKLIEIDAAGAVTVLGAISGTEQAAMENFYSFNTQGIIADGKFFLYDPTGGFREVVDPDVGDPIDGVWVDGFYFMTDGEFLFHTDINDEESIDPLNFATAEFMPDKSLGVAKTQDNKVMVFGRYTLEYFINRATANFAFERVATRAQKIGIVATHAKTEAEGNWYITGGRKMDAVGVHMITLGSSQKVSTREIDKLLAQYTEPELADMRMESRMEDDVYFILIHLPNETLCYNATISKTFGIEAAWTIVKSDVAGNTPYRAINGVFDARTAKWIYGDKIDTTIGRLDNSVFTHYDNTVEWLLFTPFLDLDSLSIDEIEIETIPGRTTFDDASVFFSMTSDGETYSKEYITAYGASLDRNKRFFLRRLGDTRDWVGFKFRGATKSRMSFAMLKVTYG